MALSTRLASLRVCRYSAVRDLLPRTAAARCGAQPRSRHLSHMLCCEVSVATVPETADSAHTPTGVAVRQNVVDVLRQRGLVYETTSDELDKAAAAETLSVYCGFDPTADSLHLGNLLGIIVLTWFARCGHRVVALIGGATGRVGDPSGKSAERPALSEAELERNVAGIQRVLTDILQRNASDSELMFLNNLEWFGSMSFLEFLRDIGKHARVGTMMSKDSVRKRLDSESGMSFTEFTYQLLQGYDFVHLYKHHGVRVQVGGSDQWGNITAGTDLMRRLVGGASDSASQSCFGLTFPLLLDAEGKKFGKSESGAVWLSADRLSPYQFYQYLFKTTDADVIRFLKMLTFMPLHEIDALEAAMAAADYKPNTAQKRLADEVTRFVHGEDGLQQALKATEALRPGAETTLDVATLEAIAADAPSASLTRDDVVGKLLADVMVAAKLQPTKAAARRLIKGGGVYVNNKKVSEELHQLAESDLIEGRVVLLAAGKKNKLLLRVHD